MNNWACEPKNTAGLEGAATEPQGAQVCPPTLGFESLLPEQDISLIEAANPDEAQNLLMPVGTMSMVMYKNEIIGNLKYETQFLELLHLELPDHGPKIIQTSQGR